MSGTGALWLALIRRPLWSEVQRQQRREQLAAAQVKATQLPLGVEVSA